MKDITKVFIMVLLAIVCAILSTITPQYCDLYIGYIGGIIWGIVICR